MWYKEKYRIVTENPYNKEKLNGLPVGGINLVHT